MDEFQSVGVGIALGLVLVSILTRFPGEPFDYANSSSASDAEAPAVPVYSTALDDSSAESSAAISAARMGHQQEEREHQIAEVVRMAQRVKVQKLQELIGLEKTKAQQLVDGAKQEAIEAITAGGRSSGKYSGPGTNYGVWLDRMFFATMLALLVWALQRDYGIDVVSIATHLFPREAEATRQVATIPQYLLHQLAALWG
ncbi:hypothetical protein BBJ28_00011269 [Nothophytophthora sp. Chile5]|nr:hypothetical protein BBJ28_00011269 [Nothophytophthora sp. Chile5]